MSQQPKMEASPSSSSSSSLWRARRAIALPIMLALLCCLPMLNIFRSSGEGRSYFHDLGIIVNKFADGSSPSSSSSSSSTPLTRKTTSSPSLSLSLEQSDASKSVMIGRRIVDRAFNESFVDLVNYCHKSGQTPQELQGCISHIFKATKVNSLDFAKKWPWWFQTMMRDAAMDPELYQPWHEVQFQDPNLQLCVIEKIGSKQFYKFHCKASDITGVKVPKQCYKQQGPLLPDSDRSVFLRDPLERFLSGFINKCIERRDDQKHCQPRQVFANRDTNLVSNFYSNTKKLFEAYVDAMPLTWDLHFLPQSLYCGGLYNSLQNFAFVGNMGDHFYQDLDRFGEKYPRLDPYLREQFPVRERQGNSQLLEYYTPATVQKVLEYHAIDYVMLNLEIPEWAEKMLLNHPMVTLQ